MGIDKSKFIAGFKAEATTQLQELNLGILKLEKKPQDKSSLRTLMRTAHSLKGAATMMGFKRIAELAHKVEDGLDRALGDRLALQKKQIDLLLRCLDTMTALLEDKVTWEDKGVTCPHVEQLCREADDVLQLTSPSASTPAYNEETSSRQQESGDGPPVESSEATSKPSFESIRVETTKLDALINITGELVIARIRLHELMQDVNRYMSDERTSPAHGQWRRLVEDLHDVKDSLGILAADIEDSVIDIRLVPVADLFNSFPRAMRDLAQEKGKDIAFDISGEHTQMDKTIIDQLRDPLMHLLRNAVDHGIESPSRREAGGKPKDGKISLSAFQQGQQVVIEIADDGQGIDADAVRQKALKQGLLKGAQVDELSQEQMLQFIFQPGFSTRDNVSETSGRGVGLDVVRSSLAALKGMITVQSTPGKGTLFRLQLPLTLMMTESLMVSGGEDMFAVPVESVVETIRLDPALIRTVESKEVFTVRGDILPLIRLNDIFGLPRKGIVEKRYLPVVVVQFVEQRLGILVDEVIGRQEIIQKSIGDPLAHVPFVAGATILGNGNAILILDIPAILHGREAKPVIREPLRRLAEAPRKRHTILLAEDVLSTAMLEKNILESVGYAVVIARDGKEAFDRLAQERFDLIVTDVLMPRMDGFELTQRVKRDQVHGQTPVIIVTTRASAEDKRRGMEAGADAYILKSEFTSDKLLETIERLIG